MSAKFDLPSVKNFREYLRIPSVHPDVDYSGCVSFLQEQAKQLDLPLKIFHCVPKKPIVILTWQGKDPSLPSILLNSHMDVVPVFEDKWTYKPFGAEIDKNGNIYARGTQDMKCVGIMFLEAIRKLKKEIILKRTVHISFVPDEETGGNDGMKVFVHTEDFKQLNVGFCLDEGVASPTDVYEMFYGERSICQIKFDISGQPGHGSLLLENTAGEKLKNLLGKIYNFRDNQINELKSNKKMLIGDVTTMNATIIHGGVQVNVNPDKYELWVDCRVAPTVDLKQFEQMLKSWCTETGKGVSFTYLNKEPQIPVTKLDGSNPFWSAFEKSTDEMKLKLRPQIFPGATDSRFLREIGIPALGFSPINRTPVLAHDNDEFLHVDIFLRGIDIYSNIIQSVANV